jgi:hypothetical protein
MNVSKGEVAKHTDLQKAFNTTNVGDIVKDVCHYFSFIASLRYMLILPKRFLKKVKCKLATRSASTTSLLSAKS